MRIAFPILLPSVLQHLRYRQALLHLVLFLGQLLLHGATSAANIPHSPRFEQVAKSELSQVSILSLLQDRFGFIWIATNNGLFRFDGYDLVSFRANPDTGRSLPSNKIHTLNEDKAGQIWVGTDNGIARLNRNTNDFTSFAPKSGPPKHLNVRVVVADGAKGFWIGTWGGLQHFDPESGEFRQFVHQPGDKASIADDNVNSLVLDANGGLWVGLWNHGLDYLAPGASEFTHHRIDSVDHPDQKLNTARALYIDRQEQLWIGTENGVVAWKTKTDWSERRRLPDVPGYAKPRVFAITQDDDDTMWFGSVTEGLAYWSDRQNEFTTYSPNSADEHSISGRAVRSLLVDRQGLLWIGTLADGLSRLNLASQGFDRLLPKTISRNVLAKNNVKSIASDGRNRLWIGGSDGLRVVDLETSQLVSSIAEQPGHKGGLYSGAVFSLYHAENGVIWVGTMNGLYRLGTVGRAEERINIGEGSANYIDSISPGSKGRLWLCTGAGLIQFDPATRTITRYFHDKDSANSRSVTPTSDVLEDRRGNVWMVSGSGGGLDRLDTQTGKFTNYRQAAVDKVGPSSDRATRLHEDADGNIWVASANALDRITVDASGSLRFRSYGKQATLPFTSVQSLQSDAAGNIWLSTDSGLSRFDPVAESFTHFSTADGITGNFLFGAATRHPDGTLFFGGENGITVVRPDAVRLPRTAPPLAVTDVTILNKSLRSSFDFEGRVVLAGSLFNPQLLTMSWREPVFSIEFSALQFDAPQTLKYMYRLEGFDKEWVTTDATRRIATYTNLDHGNYTFQVRAKNRHGISSDVGIFLPITISPPFWKTVWFQISCAVAFVSAVLLLHRWRVRWLVRNQMALESLVAERTRELEESNAELARISATDGLTGLANRRLFDETLHSEWNRAKRGEQALTIAMIDVDLFKKFNDHYGHQAGDECLRQVARAIASCVRRSGDMVARYGGEEFVLVAPSIDGAPAINLATSICKAVEAMSLRHELSPYGHVTVSIGVASQIPEGQDVPEALLRRADEALYAAKKQGRNRAVSAKPAKP